VESGAFEIEAWSACGFQLPNALESLSPGSDLLLSTPCGTREASCLEQSSLSRLQEFGLGRKAGSSFRTTVPLPASTGIAVDDVLSEART
jgi:hypothetical protein